MSPVRWAQAVGDSFLCQQPFGEVHTLLEFAEPALHLVERLREARGSVGVRPALLSVLPISRRTTTCAHATTQTTNAVPMAQLGIIHTLHPPLRDCCAAKRRRSESNRRIEVLQTSALPLGYGAVGLENA